MLQARTGRAVLVAFIAVLALTLPGVAASDPSDDPAATGQGGASPSPLDRVLAALAPDAVTPLATSDPAAVPGPRLPACRIGDKLTRYHLGKQWKKSLLDTNLRLKRSYVPYGLVSVSRAGLKGTGRVRKLVIRDLRAMARAARRAGKPLAVRSAYRSYATQAATFASWVRRSGYQQALKFSARPGHSEHQLGTTIDFTTAPGQPLSSSFGTSKQGRWMARNAWKFGFIDPYPKGKRKVSCYGYEPWHWRYVGRELARKIHESGMVPRRYYWRNFETAP